MCEKLVEAIINRPIGVQLRRKSDIKTIINFQWQNRRGHTPCVPKYLLYYKLYGKQKISKAVNPRDANDAAPYFIQRKSGNETSRIS